MLCYAFSLLGLVVDTDGRPWFRASESWPGVKALVLRGWMMDVCSCHCTIFGGVFAPRIAQDAWQLMRLADPLLDYGARRRFWCL